MNFGYEKVTEDFLSILSERSKIIISRRFALNGKKAETLEKIGKDYNITRERVRQIEADSIKKIKKNFNHFKSKKEFDEIQAFFISELKIKGGIKKETLFLKTLGKEKDKNYIIFLLHLSDGLKKTKEEKNYHASWTLNNDIFNEAKEVIKEIIKLFKETKTPLNIQNLAEAIDFNKDKETLKSFIELSKKIETTFNKKEYGLSVWPEVYPKTVRDKIYLILKQQKKPLHFKEISKKIENLNSEILATSACNKKLHPQTIHNELIRNNNFVLIGRGIYALREWGYNEGQVKDVILDILKNTKNSLTKEEVISLVSEKRIVKKSTILLNLQNKEIFAKDHSGKYKIKES